MFVANLIKISYQPKFDPFFSALGYTRDQLMIFTLKWN